MTRKIFVVMLFVFSVSLLSVSCDSRAKKSNSKKATTESKENMIVDVCADKYREMGVYLYYEKGSRKECIAMDMVKEWKRAASFNASSGYYAAVLYSDQITTKEFIFTKLRKDDKGLCFSADCRTPQRTRVTPVKEKNGITYYLIEPLDELKQGETYVFYQDIYISQDQDNVFLPLITK